ncbi:hypothetical protein OG394_26745 [Kribbella sp. NBC_01245]|uniref:hypothetical protein n=1 Tax=Kribbella sp. NBC_01245 TaxID=2903578 RepID=UPI002E2985F2|nr:hypothetical protein [Kribbella sp. NBC_01245]
MPDFDDDELSAQLDGPEPEALTGPSAFGADETPKMGTDKAADKARMKPAPRIEVKREVTLEPTPPQLAVPPPPQQQQQPNERPGRQDLRQEAAAERNIAYADRGLAHELRAGDATPEDLDRAEQLQGSADHYDRMAAADDAEADAVYPNPADGSQPPPGGAVQTPPGKTPKARKSLVRGKGRARGRSLGR